MKIIATSDLNQKYIFIVVLMLIGLTQTNFGQPINQTQNKADQTLRSNARVNPSTLGMEFSLPLGGYVGRAGNDKPLTLEYSSKVWGSFTPDTWETQTGTPVTDLRPQFAKGSVRGWTTSLQAPRIEFPDDRYGHPMGGSEGQLMVPDGSTTLYYIKRLNVFMPDGSAYEMRQDDNLYEWGQSTGTFDFYGTYLSVDGSQMRLDVNTSQSVLYFPDGGRMLFDSNGNASSYIDSNGNKTTYNSTPHQWTDTLGRVLTNPLPASQGEIGTFQPTEGTQNYQFPGYNGQNQQAEFIWAKLSTQHSSPAYMTSRFCLSFQDKNLPSGSTILFTVVGIPTNACDPFTTPFDPIILTEVRLQNGSAYKFHYNLFGEIDRIDYPTGGYERFEYGQIPPIQSAGDAGYDQFNRGVKKRWVSSDGTSGSEVLWQYDVTRVNQELPTDYYKIRTTAPDNSYTEQYLFDQDSDLQYPWGFGNIAIGRPFEERAYSTTGQLIGRKLTKYTKTGSLTGGYTGASRDLRPEKEISIIFETGNNYALAQKSETVYDTDGNSDPAYFSSLNPEQTKIYHYVAVSTANAQPSTSVADTEFNRIANLLSSAQIANTTETDYLYDSNYKARNINGLVRYSFLKDASGAVKAKSEIIYDETYLLETALIADRADWQNPGTTVRGLPTTTRSWYDPTVSGNYIETKASYDQFGNIRKSWDGKGNFSEIEYTDNYTDEVDRSSFALPTKTISYLGAGGTGTQFISTVEYDFNTGLARYTTDPNNQTTEMEYDASLRPTKVTAPNGHQTITEYGVPDTSGQLPVGQRFVKVKTQIDATNWQEGYSWFDGLGRTIKSQSIDSNGDVFTETEYDNIGRPWKVTNPFRTGETIYKTENFYDAAGRLSKVKTADGAEVETFYSLAATGAQIGTVVTVEDQANKQRRSITNGLGQLVRVDEPDITNGNQLGTIDAPNQPTFYEYDTLNNLKTVKQGGTFEVPTQTRSFQYDALSRLKQATNPESGLISYQYDNNSNLTQKTDARNVHTVYAYDVLNRVTAKDYSDSTYDVTYTYENTNIANSKGKLTKVDNGFSKTEYTQFDILGRVTKSKQTTDGTAYGDEMEYTYNLSGALIEEKYPSGRIVKTTLDNDGDLAQVESAKTQTGSLKVYANSFTYTAAGAVSSMRLGNGRWKSTQFNSRLQPIQIALGTSQQNAQGTSPTASNLLKLDYSYGTTANNGNVQSQTITVPTVGSNTGFSAVQTYTYDSLNRIKDAKEMIGTTETWKQTFDYDRFGNRKFIEALTTTLPKNCGTSPNMTVCPGDNPSANTSDNRLSTSAGFTFDNSGNTIKNPQNRKFTYDGENKQIKVETVDENDNVTGTLGEYWYDGDGKRVKMIAYENNQPSDTTIFVYDIVGRMVAEYSTIVASETQAKVSYLTSDPLGSPRLTTDASGNTISRRDFHPFGEEIGTMQRTQGLGYTAEALRQKFTGKQRDIESGLDYFEARYYSSKLGRFTSPDEFTGGPDELFDFADDAADNPTFYADLEEPQSLNKYQYCYNNPLNLVDPDGHKPKGTEYPDIKGIQDQYGELYDRINKMRDDSGINEKRFSQRMARRSRGSRNARRGLTWAEGTFKPRRFRPRPRQPNDKPIDPWVFGRDFPNLRTHWVKHAPNGMSQAQYLQHARNHVRPGGYGFRQMFNHNGQSKWGYITRTGNDTFIFTSTSRDGRTIFTHYILSGDGKPISGQVIRNMGINVTSYPENFVGPIGGDGGRNE